MKPLVYIETTIPSYYHSTRAELAADIARTREWWDQERGDYDCYVSAVVLDELAAGTSPNQADCLQLVQEFPLLEVTDEVLEIADVYHVQKLMPKPPIRDALHMALASHYRMDFLLTWNCRHLANANKVRHLEVVNTRLGLKVPALVTPDLLRPWEDRV